MGILGNPVLLGSSLKQSGGMVSVNAKFEVDIPLVQSGSGDPSTTNIRPIKGYSRLLLYYSGRNLIKYPYDSGSPFSSNNVTFTVNADGTVSTSGQSTGTARYHLSYRYSVSYYLPVGQYKLTGCPSGGSSTTYYMWVNGGGMDNDAIDTGDGVTFTVTDSSVGIGVGIDILSGTYGNGLVFSPMIVPAGADDTFVTPKELQIIPYSWTSSGLIASGTLDILTGKLTVTRLAYSFDGTETAWASQSSGSNRFFRFTVSGITTTSSLARACSHYPNATVTSSQTTVGYYAYTTSGGSNAWLQFRPNLTDIPDLASWKTFLANQAANDTPVTCYFTPTAATRPVIQLTPAGIEVTPGDNRIWTDAGAITLNLSK